MLSCAWSLNEITSAIAADLVSDGARASAVALARCSRSIQEPVLCQVWRSLSGLAPLVKCFPPEVWETKHGKLSFKRALFRTEWCRFQQQYASKVRCLVVPSASVISLAALQLLQLYSGRSPLLPELMSLTWDSDTYLPFITSFISRSLTSISINVPATAGLILPPILTTIPSIAPDISDIEVRRVPVVHVFEPTIEEASSQLLMQCNPQRLRAYKVDAPLSASALSHIIQLPSLEVLWLTHSTHFPDPLPNIVFPSLQLLDIEFDGDFGWLKLLPETPVLSTIYVEYLGPDVEQFMEAFQLTTVGCGMHERLQDFTLRNPAKINHRIISCNLSFKNLTCLQFLTSCVTPCRTLDLTDVHIDLLTNAMPLLITLSIGQQPCSVPSKITFNSLYTISRRCTRLKTLQVHFNPNSFITKVLNADSGNGIQNGPAFETPSPDLCSVTKFDVGSIPLPSNRSKASEIMASGLLGVFPRLEEVEYLDVAWKDVNSLIGFRRRINTAFASLRG